jgi:hypothetical protein
VQHEEGVSFKIGIAGFVPRIVAPKCPAHNLTDFGGKIVVSFYDK